MEKTQSDVYNKIDPDADVRAIFDRENPNWSNTPEYVHLFVHHTMNFMHDKLRSQGYLFVNDVLRALGIDLLPEGQLLGWKTFKKDPGENMDYSFTSDNESGWIVLKNVEFIWHTL